MENFKGTRGTWQAIGTYVGLNNQPIRITHFNGSNSIEEDIANALLCSKSPEMLEMLQDLLKSVDWSYESWDSDKGIFYKQQIEQLIKEATDLNQIQP